MVLFYRIWLQQQVDNYVLYERQLVKNDVLPCCRPAVFHHWSFPVLLYMQHSHTIPSSVRTYLDITLFMFMRVWFIVCFNFLVMHSSFCLSICTQWRRQLWGTGARAPSTSNNFIFSPLWSKSESQLSQYCVVCEISWCRCQQLAAFSISTAPVTKLLVIEQLLHPALKFAVSAPWPSFQLCPSSQQILATPLFVPLSCSVVFVRYVCH